MDFSVYFFSANDQIDFGSRYDFIIEVAKYADQHGYTAMWTPERHFQQFGGSFPNPSVLAAAMATVTKRISLRAGSVVLPHHHPARIVEEWALVDQLSKGRVGLCFATGWHRGDFVFYPENYTRRRELTFSSIKTIRDLWAGHEVTFSGVEGQPVPLRVFPRPYQRELPLWLVHTSNPETWIKAGEIGANVLTLLDNIERLQTNISRYRQAREQAGLDPRTGIVTLGLHTFIGSDEAEVRQIVADPVKQYLRTFLLQKTADASLQGESKTSSSAEQELIVNLAFEDLYVKKALLGTIPKCASLVRRLQEMGVSEIACLIDFGLDFRLVFEMLPKLDELRAMFQPSTGAGAGAGAKAQADEDDMSWYYDR